MQKINTKMFNTNTIWKQIVETYFFSKINIYNMSN